MWCFHIYFFFNFLKKKEILYVKFVKGLVLICSYVLRTIIESYQSFATGKNVVKQSTPYVWVYIYATRHVLYLSIFSIYMILYREYTSATKKFLSFWKSTFLLNFIFLEIVIPLSSLFSIFPSKCLFCCSWNVNKVQH